MRHLLLYLLALILAPAAAAQSTNETQKHLIYFTDKAATPFTTEQPEKFLTEKAIQRRSRQNITVTTRDLPVVPAYVTGLKQQGVKVWYTSRRFNAAVVQATTEQLAQISQLPYVRSTQALNRLVVPPQQAITSTKLEAQAQQIIVKQGPEIKDYGSAWHQANMLGATYLHSAGFTGEGLTIAIFDAGFPAVNTLPAFTHLFQENRLKGSYDFVRRMPDAYTASSHGTNVLSTMAAFEPGKMIGTAYGADYYLFRTEDAASEHNIEEINWLIAAEYADSAGVDVINSSLGYTTFDAPSKSYTYNDLNGDKALITQAADFAAATGMLVVVSAGNEGNKPWRYISAPADADSVLTVGAVDSLGYRATFSSVGPTADGRIKPDLAALGFKAYVLTPAGSVVKSNGTSFSSPILAGMAACLWQANPDKTNLELIELLKQIGSNAANPNSQLGYGVPNYKRLLLNVPAEAVLMTNPVVSDYISLTLGEQWVQQPANLQVYDINGRQMFSKALQAGQQQQVLSLAPHTLKPGMYLCRLTAGDQSTTIRFIKL